VFAKATKVGGLGFAARLECSISAMVLHGTDCKSAPAFASEGALNETAILLVY
jgi:hypothetical protein